MGGNRIETAEFSGRVLMVGCGSIGQAMLPLLRRHLSLPEDGLTVLEASGANFSDSALGARVSNITDGSSCEVTSFTATSLTCDTAIAGLR